MIRSDCLSEKSGHGMHLPLAVVELKTKKKCCKKYLKKDKYCKSCPERAKKK